MKDISILIPLHKSDDDTIELLKNAIKSVDKAQKLYTNGSLKTYVVTANEDITNSLYKLDEDKDIKYNVIKNYDGNSDYCSQINFAVENIDTDFFSILEYDDEYSEKWFKLASEYYYGNEEISVFLPIILNDFKTEEEDGWAYGNTMALSPTFITSNENDKDDIGIINKYRIQNCSIFNLSGAIFNTSDFKKCGKYKPSIKVAFNYELLLRMTENNFNSMVVPKIGYIHKVNRVGSMTEEYLKSTTNEERKKWFILAETESKYVEDRNNGIDNVVEETVK